MAIRFKETLRWLRKEAGMTQKDLSKLVNVCPQTLRSWEYGKAEPSFDDIDKLAELFGVTPGDMMNGFEFEEGSK